MQIHSKVLEIPLEDLRAVQVLTKMETVPEDQLMAVEAMKIQTIHLSDGPPMGVEVTKVQGLPDDRPLGVQIPMIQEKPLEGQVVVGIRMKVQVPMGSNILLMESTPVVEK